LLVYTTIPLTLFGPDLWLGISFFFFAVILHFMSS